MKDILILIAGLSSILYLFNWLMDIIEWNLVYKNYSGPLEITILEEDYTIGPTPKKSPYNPFKFVFGALAALGILMFTFA